MPFLTTTIITIRTTTTISMQLCPSWEANNFSPSLNSPHFVETKGSLPLQEVLRLVPILREMNLVSALPPYIFKIKFNIILPYKLNDLFPPDFHINPVCTGLLQIRATYLFVSSSRYYYAYNIWWEVKTINHHYEILQHPVISSLVGTYTLRGTLSSKTPSLCCSLNVRNQYSRV